MDTLVSPLTSKHEPCAVVRPKYGKPTVRHYAWLRAMDREPRSERRRSERIQLQASISVIMNSNGSCEQDMNDYVHPLSINVDRPLLQYRVIMGVHHIKKRYDDSMGPKKFPGMGVDRLSVAMS